MNENISAVAFALVVMGSTVAAYLYWQHLGAMPQPAIQGPPTAAQPAPSVRRTIDAPPGARALPRLAESDPFVFDSLSALVGNGWLMKVFGTGRIIHNIVATVDNLPRMRAPMEVMPIAPASGLFATNQTTGGLTISPKNAARYAPYMRLAEVLDSRKLVEFYLRFYPLFQQAYEELGYPHTYFNDRLMETLDDLLSAPDVREPVELVQPHVQFQYADPDLEALSIGQRIMIRIGSRNETELKGKLRDIKRELSLHLRDVALAPGASQ